MWHKRLNTPRHGAPRLALVVVVAGWSNLCAAQPAAGTESPDKLNELIGFVVEADGRTPVERARVVAADAVDGFIMFESLERLHFFGPDETVLLFFTKQNGKGAGETVTDADGAFKITGLRSGTYNLLAGHPERGINVARGVRQPNADNPPTIILRPGAYVEGVIRGIDFDDLEHSGYLTRPGGPSVDNIDIRPSFTLDVGGRFRAGPVLKGGTWNLTLDQFVANRGFANPILRLPVTLKSGETSRVDIDLNGGHAIEGHVVGPDGKPLHNAGVTLRSLEAFYDSAPTYGALSDVNGKYVVRGVRPGDYRLEVKRWAKKTGFG